jgi:hypothetical protein
MATNVLTFNLQTSAAKKKTAISTRFSSEEGTAKKVFLDVNCPVCFKVN